jgi:hypothetical protein
MIINNKWEIDTKELHIFHDLDIYTNISLNIKDNIMRHIVIMLKDTSYIYSLKINELVHIYQAIDYLNINSLIDICAQTIAKYMNRTSIKNINRILNKLNIL